MSKLLLLEDDLSLIDGLTYSLNKAGYRPVPLLFCDDYFYESHFDAAVSVGAGYIHCQSR